MGGNKRIRKILVVILALTLLSGNSGCAKDKGKSKAKVTNDSAEKKKYERYLTIINKTGQVINEVHITVDEGTEIEAAYQKNPNEDSFSVKIPKEYKEYSIFDIILEDRYGFQYEKKISDVKKTGRTAVSITEKDKVKQKGDWKRKLDQVFNGD